MSHHSVRPLLSMLVVAVMQVGVSYALPYTGHDMPRQHFAGSGILLWEPGDELSQLHLTTIVAGKVGADRAVFPPHIVNPLEGMVGVGSLSPDGRSALLTPQKSPYNSDLVILDLTTRRLHRLTKTGDYYDWAWSPDGRYILGLRENAHYDPATHQHIEGKSQLNVLDANTGKICCRVDYAYAPIWARDSKSVVFSRFPEYGLHPPPGIVMGKDSGQHAPKWRRRFFAVSLENKLRQLSDHEVDQKIGSAYRPLITAFQEKNPGVAYSQNMPTSVGLSPDGKYAILIMGTSMMDAVGSDVKITYYLIDRHGIISQHRRQGDLDFLRWSLSGHRIYCVDSADVDSNLAVIDSKTGKLTRLALGASWASRRIMDFHEQSSRHTATGTDISASESK